MHSSIRILALAAVGATTFVLASTVHAQPAGDGKAGMAGASQEQPSDFKAQSEAIAKKNLEARQQKKSAPRDGNINDAVWGTSGPRKGPEGSGNGGAAAGGSSGGKAGTR